MINVLYLAWRYLVFHKFKTAILVLSVTLIAYIPAGLRVLIRQSQADLTARAAATPLLIGAKGSPLELVLNSLYASGESPPSLPYHEVSRVAETGLAQSIPLYVRFRSRQDPIIGATLDYFRFRGLHIARGSQMVRLGDCVAGANLARRRSLSPGDSILSSPEGAFDIAGVYPLKMRITGILAFSGTPDDDAAFVDVKTAWLIEGLAHGHQDLAGPDAAGGVLSREASRITANASVVQFNEVTDDNIGSFHFHGDTATFPITAIIVVPRDDKSATLLMGRYQGSEKDVQMVQPLSVISDLLDTVLTIEDYVIAALLLVGVATLATAALVFLLSARLRRREIDTMIKIGGSRVRIAALLASEVLIVLALSALLAATLTWVTSSLGTELIQNLIASS